jgi:hypothetical protein
MIDKKNRQAGKPRLPEFDCDVDDAPYGFVAITFCATSAALTVTGTSAPKVTPLLYTWIV